MPPSRPRQLPLRKSGASAIRYLARWATSSGRPMRPVGWAKGGDDLLAREPFAIAIGMNELNEPRAADDFCSKKHLLKRIAKKKSPVNKKRKN